MADVGRDVMSVVPEMTEAALKVMQELMLFFETLMNNHQEERVAKEFLQYVKESGNILNFFCKDFCEKDFEREMKSMGCDCLTARCTDGPGKGLIVCMFKEEDRAVAEIARERAISKGIQKIDAYGNIMLPSTEVSINTINKISKDTNHNYVEKISGLSNAKAKSFSEELRTSRIVFSKVEEKNGRMSFYFSPEDKEKAATAYAKVNVNYLGVSGNYEHQRVSNDIKAVEKALSQIEKDGKEFYVVSAMNYNNIIHVTNSSVSHEYVGEGRPYSYRKVGGKEGNYDHANLSKVYKQEADAMNKPIVLSKEEYLRASKNPDEMKELIRNKMPKVIYRDEFDKINCYSESVFKNKFLQNINLKSQMDLFNIEDERERFNQVLKGNISLPDYLDGREDPCFPPINDIDAEQKKMERIHSEFESLSPEIQKEMINMMNGCLQEFENSEKNIHQDIFEETELVQSMDELINDVFNNKNFDEICTIGDPEVEGMGGV